MRSSVAKFSSLHAAQLVALGAAACAVSAVSLHSVASANAPYGSAGCGLGHMVVGNKPGFTQVFGATTNSTSGSQFFGITTGTSNCVPTGAKIGYIEQRDYIANNISSLSREASQGSGDVLMGFADVMGCDLAVRPQFSKLMQDSFSKIFTQPGTENILEASRAALGNDEVLARSCSAI